MIQCFSRGYGFYLLRLMLIVLGLFAYNTILAKDPILIPFREGKKWGLVTESKIKVVDAKYLQIQFQDPYFFCLDGKQSRYDIYSLAGKYIDSCQLFDSIDSRHYILLKSSREKYEGKLTIPDQHLGILPLSNRFQKLGLTVNIYALTNNVSKLMVKGCTNYVSLRLNDRFASASYFYKALVSKQGKFGLYDMRLQQWIVLPEYDSMRFIAPDLIIAKGESDRRYAGDVWGHALAHWPEDENALYIDKRNGNWISAQRVDSLFNGNQKIYSPHDEYIYHVAKQKVTLSLGNDYKFLPNMQEPYALEVPRHDIGKMRTYTLYDLEGNRLLDSIYECESVFRNDIFSLKGIDEEHHRTLTLGIYNFKQKKFVWKNPDSSYVSIKTDMYLPAIDKDGAVTYFNDDGEILSNQSRDLRQFQKEGNLIKKVSVYRDSIQTLNIFAYNHFYALRKDTGDAFTIYNQQLQKVDSLEDIQELINDSWHFAYRVKKHWGIADGEGRSVWPAKYVSIRKERGYYVLQTDSNQYQRIRCADWKPVPGINKDYVSDYSVNGIWLAITHSQTTRGRNRRETDSVTLECINENGEVLSSFRREGIFREYALSMKGDILEYPSDKYNRVPTVLLSPQGQILKTLPWQFLWFEEKNELRNEPISFRVANDKDRTAIVSVSDFSIIVPFEQDEEAFTQATAFTNAQGDVVKGIYIIKNEDTGNKLVGFYSASGVKYWKD